MKLRNFQKKKNIPYFETSAKNKINVNEGFEKLANDAYEYEKKKNMEEDKRNKEIIKKTQKIIQIK